ncbi:MAG: Hpt domain-containing protein [Bacteroidales bacterium]|nr:Hpt domain-containing protein [Bacteroidales bacterium]
MTPDPIQFDEILDRVSGNREFVYQMLEMFFQTRVERISVLRKTSDSHDYSRLADEAHKMKGLVGNLSIHIAFTKLKELEEAAELRNNLLIEKLINELEESISEAELYFKKSL